MYFPIGWPKSININVGSCKEIRHICCDSIKILIAFLTDDELAIWYAKPLIPITSHRRNANSIRQYGKNSSVIWKPDSSKLAVLTGNGCIIVYQVDMDIRINGIFNLIDSSLANLKRDSAELFLKESIPLLTLYEYNHIELEYKVTSVLCISLNEIMMSTSSSNVIRQKWDDKDPNNSADYLIDLQHITIYSNQNSNKPKISASISPETYVTTMDYSPLLGGFVVVFNDNRAAFLTSSNRKFAQEFMEGYWIPDMEDATCCSINHKFRLLSFGRHNSEVAIYAFDDNTGGLEFSHKLCLDSKIFSGSLGPVNELRWTPDGCAIVVSWQNGGIALWSTFGTILMCSWTWDFGLNADLPQGSSLVIRKMEWSTEGYQLFIIKENLPDWKCSVIEMDFVKSATCVNPCMTSTSHILLQADDTLYINQGNNLEEIYFNRKHPFPNNVTGNANSEIIKPSDTSNILSENKYWTLVQLPLLYSSTNWPIRYSAINQEGTHIAVAGRTGFVHYSVESRKWKLFGNETQEKEFVVTGGFLWWDNFIIMGCFSLIDRINYIKAYPRDAKLDNQFCNKLELKSLVILLNSSKNILYCLTSDGIINIFMLKKISREVIEICPLIDVDIRPVCIHPACVVSLAVTNLKTDLTPENFEIPENIILNVSGRVLMIQLKSKSNVINSGMITCLASNVECFWLSHSLDGHMKDSLWLYCGGHGMRVWLSVLPAEKDIQNRYRRHTFMVKRIMLSFPLNIYPLAILFKNVIVLGADNDTTLYSNEAGSHFSMPFCILELKTQIYLHKILRQLIKRNLGYSAWEIAGSCKDLPYFPHSLELLLHEVLEEEATSKDPIPDALLPSILDFIREFPVYLQTIVQCARKTEIALWPYLFSIAGKPKELFRQCLDFGNLQTAASYLIILQNLEPSSVSKQFATLLLQTALEKKEWELSKDLIRFLKAIDPNEVDSPRSSFIVNNKITPITKSQVSSDPEVFNLILGQIARERNFSSTIPSPKLVENLGSSVTENQSTFIRQRKSETANKYKEGFFIETILEGHARDLLQSNKLLELGYMSAFLDFQLVRWLQQENSKVGKIDNFVEALLDVHSQLNLPPPSISNTNSIDSLSDLGSVQKSVYFSDVCRNASSHTSESGFFSLTTGDNSFEGTSPNTNFLSCQGDDQMFDKSFRFNSSITPKSTNETGYLQAILPEKLEVKLRYLLQLFVEGHCIDYSLVLSIILLDAASIGRIINLAIRSESIASCNRIQSALKHVTQWSFHKRSGYRLFMMSLQPQLFMLDQYIFERQKPGKINEESKADICGDEISKEDQQIIPKRNSLSQSWTQSESYSKNMPVCPHRYDKRDFIQNKSPIHIKENDDKCLIM